MDALRKRQAIKLYIVIADFNGSSETIRCLESLHKSAFKEFSIIVVDHGTMPDSKRLIAKEYPEVTRIDGSPELWWAGATNLGIQYCLDQGATHVMLLNNDCYVHAETIGNLIRLSRTKPNAIIAPIQRDLKTSNIISIKPTTLFLLGFPTRPGPKQLSPNLLTQPLLKTSLIIGGRGAIIPKSAFETVGLLREDIFPHYGSDHDFYLNCVKQKIKLFVATSAYVDIDCSRTTIADSPENLDFCQFIETLRNTKSHRNISVISALFKHHYPIKKLYWIGILLLLFRYTSLYAVKRISLKVKNFLHLEM